MFASTVTINICFVRFSQAAHCSTFWHVFSDTISNYYVRRKILNLLDFQNFFKLYTLMTIEVLT